MWVRVQRWEAGGMRLMGVVLAGLVTLALVNLALVNLAAVDSPVALAGSSTPVQPRIVGGASTRTAEHPWMVALTTATSASAYCAGALIGADRVVTAAHCITDYRPDGIRVIAGRTDLRSSDGQERQVLRYWIHPDYTSPEHGDDVAVLFLDRALPYPTLPLETDPGAYWAGAPATVLGWGYTAERGPSSSELRSADVVLVADSDCAATYRQFDQRAMVCAGTARGGSDACYGDSGGPLVAGGRLIGVTSWGSGCARAGRPGVYTRVASYAAEIDAQRPEPVELRRDYSDYWDWPGRLG
ncbi:MAG TPA: serine protease [Pseudonocardiaceae bacterium]